MDNSRQHLSISNEVESSEEFRGEAEHSSQKETVKLTEKQQQEFSFFKEGNAPNKLRIEYTNNAIADS